MTNQDYVAKNQEFENKYNSRPNYATTLEE